MPIDEGPWPIPDDDVGFWPIEEDTRHGPIDDDYGYFMNTGGQVENNLNMNLDQMLNKQGIGSLLQYQSNVAPFQEAFRPNKRR